MSAPKKDFLIRPLLHQIGIAAGFAIIAGSLATVIAAELVWIWRLASG
jgi:hypothetical protein